MDVKLVRSDVKCDPMCPHWIVAHGFIDDRATFLLEVILELLGDRKLPILVDSPGGLVSPGMDLARLIRKHGLDVIVAKVALQSCRVESAGYADCIEAEKNGIKIGVPVADIATCASACTLLIAGGLNRIIGPASRIGVHEVKRVLGLGATAPTDAHYDRIRAFYRDMGIQESIVDLWHAASSNDMYWLSAQQLRETGLATAWIGGPLVKPSPRLEFTQTAPHPRDLRLCMIRDYDKEVFGSCLRNLRTVPMSRFTFPRAGTGFSSYSLQGPSAPTDPAADRLPTFPMIDRVKVEACELEGEAGIFHKRFRVQVISHCLAGNSIVPSDPQQVRFCEQRVAAQVSQGAILGSHREEKLFECTQDLATKAEAGASVPDSSPPPAAVPVPRPKPTAETAKRFKSPPASAPSQTWQPPWQ